MAGEKPFDTVADILAGRKTGQAVRLRGWVHRQRASGGKLAFVVLRDGTGTVQCTVKGGVVKDEESLQQALRAKLEASVGELDGDVVADARAPGGFEVKVTKFRLHEPGGAASGDFPLRGEQGTEFELDKRHLWLRSTELSAIFRIKHRLYKAIRDFYDGEGFTEVDPSVITTNACEGGSTLFTFDYFGQTAYLSQSAQMYLEGMIFGLPKVYCITPSFRAEKSRTTKHLTEFHHLEAEAAWWDAEENRKHQEKLVTYLAHTIAKECEVDLKLLGQDPKRLLAVKAPFERMDYSAAIKGLQRQGFKIEHGEDFGVPHEKALTEGKTSPIFICDWPAKIKAFYMAEKPGTDRVLCSDMLAPDGFGEIIGGSQRSEDAESMTRRLWLLQWVQLAENAAGQISRWPHASALHNAAPTDPMKWLSSLPQSKVEATLREFWALSGHNDQLLLSDDESTWLLMLSGNTIASLSRISGAPDKVWRQTFIEKFLIEPVLGPYEWYFDLRRYGSVPHSGFGLGIERLLRWFTGQEHIRDMLPYPRTPGRASP
ncbi:MAG TPA: amino acid--tRNA ligase-related protein [Candidatus Thermoplasmatota archaeon]|nr:amino acid--tRNA ligase-related protein [Candidatus Thermoplasmatota archaeon]